MSQLKFKKYLSREELTMSVSGRLLPAARVLRCFGAALILLLVGRSVTIAAINFEADPILPLPEETAVFTHDPYEAGKNLAERGIATTSAQGQRNLRQTFQLAQSINIGEIIFSLDVNDPTAGLQIRIYEVDNITASWNPGTKVQEFAIPSLVSTTNWLGLSFTGGDVFNLPARSSGTTGYGIEFSDNLGIVGTTLGPLRYNNEGVDHYSGGVFYSESATFAVRDIGLMILGTLEEPCDPGDTNCDGFVDVDTDLAAIASHFRQDVTLREQGDLTGNNFVDFDDFDEWKQHYTGALSDLDLSFLRAATVPEPTSLAILVLGMGQLIAARRRRS